MEIASASTANPAFTADPGKQLTIADRILDSVIPDLGLREGDRVANLVNGLGATPQPNSLYRRTYPRLTDPGSPSSDVGEYATSLEMAGAISLLVPDDASRAPRRPAQSPFREAEMRSRELIRQIQASMSLLIESSDELRDLDRSRRRRPGHHDPFAGAW